MKMKKNVFLLFVLTMDIIPGLYEQHMVESGTNCEISFHKSFHFSDQNLDRRNVLFFHPSGPGLIEMLLPDGVHIVPEIGEFDLSGERIRLKIPDVVEVGHIFLMRQRHDGIGDPVAEDRTKVVGGQRGIFERIVKVADAFFLRRIEKGGHVLRMMKIRHALRILLTHMRNHRDSCRGLNQHLTIRHISLMILQQTDPRALGEQVGRFPTFFF